MKNIAVVHGPNLNLLGEREPEVYGAMTLADLNQEVAAFAQAMGLEIRVFQSNSEGTIIDFLHEQRKWADGCNRLDLVATWQKGTHRRGLTTQVGLHPQDNLIVKLGLQLGQRATAEE